MIVNRKHRKEVSERIRELIDRELNVCPKLRIDICGSDRDD